MAINKQKKESILDELKDIVKDAKTLVFVNFVKLSVAHANELRRSLQKEGIGYKVAKKTLIKKVFGEKYSGDFPELPGQIGVAYATDELSPAREVYNFQKTHKEFVSIAGGVFSGAFLDQTKMMLIATIPPREVLLSQLAYLLKSPIQRIAIAVSEVAKSKAASN